MCGIAGIVNPGSGPGDGDRARRLKAMVEALSHRGPDGLGCWESGACGLAHSRLAIVDLAGGAQPMAEPGGRLCVVFNGEIYGFEALRAGLDYPFRTRSDTEVLLALYRRHGLDMLEHLPGMFAFAIWDEAEQRLFCARDRFGEKPFYYARGRDGAFVFASEVKAVLASGLVDADLDSQALSEFLVYSYIPEGRSIHGGIAALKPGCALTLGPEGLRVWRYWDLPETRQDITAEAAAEELSALLEQSVRRCLVADVEVGVLLSGGLDSTTLGLLAARQGRLKTFSFGFEGWRNELPFAREAAQAMGSEHIELLESQVDLPHALLSLARHYDEPFGDLSAIPTLSLCRLVRSHVKVALGGDGADELMGGYVSWYQALLDRPGGGNALADWSDCAEGHWRQQQIYFRPEELEALGLPPVRRPLSPDYHGGLDDAMRLDLRGFLPGDILKKVDRAAMAFGLELRLPFLDWPVAEFLAALPWRLKLDGNRGKLVLRRAFERLWPESIRTRGKQGFSADVDAWLKRPDIVPLRRRYLLEKGLRIRSVLPGELLDAGADDLGYRGWLLLVLSLWLEQDARTRPGPRQ